MKFTTILHIFFRGKSAYQFITPWKEAVQVSLDSPSFTLNMNQSGFCIRTHSSWCRQLHTSVTGQSTGFVVLSLHNIQCITRNFKCLLLVQGRLLPYYGAFFWKKPLPWIRKWWYAFYFYTILSLFCCCSTQFLCIPIISNGFRKKLIVIPSISFHRTTIYKTVIVYQLQRQNRMEI